MPRKKNSDQNTLTRQRSIDCGGNGTAIAPPTSVRLSRLSLRLNREPKRHPKPIEGVHRCDGDREIHKVLRREGGAGCRVGLIGGVCLADPRDLLRPGESRAVLFREQMGHFGPHRNQHNLFERHRIEQVARMQVDTMRAAIDLRHPQEDEVDQFRGEIGARGNLMVDTVERFGSLRGHLVPGQPRVLAHVSSSCLERRRSTFETMTSQAPGCDMPRCLSLEAAPIAASRFVRVRAGSTC